MYIIYGSIYTFRPKAHFRFLYPSFLPVHLNHFRFKKEFWRPGGLLLYSLIESNTDTLSLVDESVFHHLSNFTTEVVTCKCSDGLYASWYVQVTRKNKTRSPLDLTKLMKLQNHAEENSLSSFTLEHFLEYFQSYLSVS